MSYRRSARLLILRIAKLINIRANLSGKLNDVLREAAKAAQTGACQAPSDTYAWECNLLLKSSWEQSIKNDNLEPYISGKRLSISISQLTKKINSLRLVAHGYNDSDRASWRKPASSATPRYRVAGRHSACQEHLKHLVIALMVPILHEAETSISEGFRLAQPDQSI